MEGMNIVIDTPILNGADADVPADELTFIISKPPNHGYILNQLTSGTFPVTNFTLDQIREASSIVYEHDDSETTEDSLMFYLLMANSQWRKLSWLWSFWLTMKHQGWQLMTALK